MFFYKVYEFSLVFGWFSRKKGRNQQNLEIFGVLRCGVGTPRRNVGPFHSVAWLHHGVEREALGNLGYDTA